MQLGTLETTRVSRVPVGGSTGSSAEATRRFPQSGEVHHFLGNAIKNVC